jgi:hypothetical protein
MKKIYLSLLFCCLAFAGFATTWYTSAAGDATVLSNWNSVDGGGGTVPTSFTNPADTWVIDSGMSCSSSLAIAGSVTISNAYFEGPAGAFTIGGNLLMTGNAEFDAAGLMQLYIAGNLTIQDNAYIYNQASYTTIILNSTTSTIAGPQTISWTSTQIGQYAQLDIVAGSVVQLLTDVTLPSNAGYYDLIDGTLICDTHVLNCNFNAMIINDGALYTANVGGIDASITNAAVTYAQDANYVFNGTAAQITGASFPAALISGGSLSINNPAGVTLSSPVSFNTGSTIDLINGKLDITAGLTMNAGANIVRDNGTFSAVPSFAGAVNVTYANLGYNASTVNTDLELPGGTAMLNNLTINKPAAVINLYDDAQVNGTLNLTSGVLRIGDNDLTVASAIGGTFSSSSMIVTNGSGYVTTLLTGNATYMYPVGDTSGNYSPITVGYTGTGYGAGALGVVNVVNAKQPHNANTTDYINRYWTVGALGVTGLSYTVSATYVPADVVGTEANISMGEYVSLPWVKYGSTNTATHTLSATGVTGVVSSFSGISTAAPAITLAGDTAICPGSATALSVAATTGDGPFTYTWAPAGSLATSTGATTLASPAVPTTYTVTVTDANGFTGTATRNVLINPLPAAFAVTGGGAYCFNGTGATVGLAGSVAGVKYQLYNASTLEGAPLGGTGGAISFGLQTATGPYIAVATDTITGCVNNMSGSVIVTTNPLPATFAVTGGGAYCFGGSGVHIDLSGSATGFRYQLYRGATATVDSLNGTGATLDFGAQMTGGTYWVEAIDTTTGCMDSMTAHAVIVVNPLPGIYTTVGGGNYCAGGAGLHIYLDSANTGINYQLYNGITATGAPVAGMDTVLDFGLQTAIGIYTVMAVNATTGCFSNMAGSPSINIIPVVIPSVSVAMNTADTICAGTSTTYTATGTNGGVSPTYQWQVNGANVGTSSNTFTYEPINGDMVTINYTSSAACAMPDTVVSSVTMDVLPNGVPVVTLTSAPGDTVCTGTGVTITATPTYGGTAPTFTWIKNTTPVSTASSYAYVPVDGDAVYVIMNSNYMCRIDTVAYSLPLTFTVEDHVIPSVILTSRPGTYVGPGRADTVIATVTNGGTNPSYQWYLNASPVPAATSSMFIRSSFTNKDSVSCIVTRNDACHMNTINSIVIYVTDVAVPFDELTMTNIALVPNPNKGIFSVKGTLGSTEDAALTIEVMNMLGQVIYKNNATAQGGHINEQIALGNNLPQGNYILNLRTTNGGNNVFRFVVE